MGPSQQRERRKKEILICCSLNVANLITKVPYGTSITMSLWNDKERKKRKVTSVVTEQDRDTLRQHYTFLPSSDQSSWENRMVWQYHSMLYKDVVLANMTRVVKQRKLGLRWRTAQEVRAGRGTATCGNLHCSAAATTTTDATHMQPNDVQRLHDYANQDCPATEEMERNRVTQLPYGALLTGFEVPFTYKEQGERKTELVTLNLCIRCAPLLFQSKGEKEPYVAACRARNGSSTDVAATTTPTPAAFNDNDAHKAEEQKKDDPNPKRKASKRIKRDIKQEANNE